MSRRDAKDKLIRVLELTVEALGFIMMILPFLHKPKSKQNRKK